MRRRAHTVIGWLVVVLAALAAGAACKHESRTGAAPPGSAAPAGTAPGPAASKDDPWAATGPVAPLLERPLLWAATKDGQTTYLLGTIHLGVNADAQLPAWTKAKLDGARVFAMEADVSDPRLLSSFQRTDGGSLRLDLGPEHWTQFEGLVGADLARGLDKMKPLAAITVLSTKFLPTTLPMDSVLETRAKNGKKPIVYLEDGMRPLEIVEPFMTGADVKAMLDNLEYAKTQTVEMLADYQRGDEVALGKQFDDQTLWVAAGRDPAQFGGFLDALLANRNATWIPKIEEIGAAGGGFVAVGAGHLVGPKNVLGMLAERGFTITRVTAPVAP